MDKITLKDVVYNFIANQANESEKEMEFFASVLCNAAHNDFFNIKTKNGFSKLMELHKDVESAILSYQIHKNKEPYIIVDTKNNDKEYCSKEEILAIVLNHLDELFVIFFHDVERYAKFWAKFGIIKK